MEKFLCMTFLMTFAAMPFGCRAQSVETQKPEQTGQQTAKVYFTREISPAALVRIYNALGRKVSGRVAVKLSTGEPGGNNFLQPALIGDPSFRKTTRAM